MRALLRFVQVELRTAYHHIDTMIQEVLEHFLQQEDLRPAIDKRQHDHAERRLHLRVLV